MEEILRVKAVNTNIQSCDYREGLGNGERGKGSSNNVYKGRPSKTGIDERLVSDEAGGRRHRYLWFL